MPRKNADSNPAKGLKSGADASLTVRRLDDGTKQGLRLRAARHGRSVEDEVRTILRQAAQTGDGDAHQPHSDQNFQDIPQNRAARSPAASTASLRVTLIIGGGIAAYKSLDLIRRLKERGCHVRCVLTHAAQQFVTPLAVSALAHERAYTDLFDPQSEFDAGHIRLARDCDLIIVAPATADLMAKVANGIANDLASAILLATRNPVLLAPAMNPAMWTNKATQRNALRLRDDGVHFIGPERGEMAETNEAGLGRMSEPLQIAQAALALLRPPPQTLRGKKVLVTAGPTHEPIDPVRYIANRSSGKQGFAIAAAAARAGADVTLIAGPVTLDNPPGCRVIRVESARDMLAQTQEALPVDIAIFAAAVADWRVVQEGEQKIKKQPGIKPQLELTENPDILATIAKGAQRPPLVIGFAAETENLIANAQAKLARKGCDWIVANDVAPKTGIMGGDRNTIHIVTASNVETWPDMTKESVAEKLIAKVADAISG